jgi:SAM-dependent methyltransferase
MFNAISSYLKRYGPSWFYLEWRLPWIFMLPRDIGLFLISARTDAEIERVCSIEGPRAAFEAAYLGSDDPWASASVRFRYQRLKYDKLIGFLPERRYACALDIGCGLGLLSQKLALRAQNVLGMDLSAAAIEHARVRGATFDNLQFQQGDILDLPSSLDGQFDLVVVADVIYYLQELDEQLLKRLANRIADLLSPGGTLLLANHFFIASDSSSKISRKIHRVFLECPRFALLVEHRRAFFLTSLFTEVQPGPDHALPLQSMPTEMPAYRRLYFLDAAKQAYRQIEFMCTNDDEATAAAEAFSQGHRTELWAGEQRMACFNEAPTVGHAAVPRRFDA